jgi:hypothetical protein
MPPLFKDHSERITVETLNTDEGKATPAAKKATSKKAVAPIEAPTVTDAVLASAAPRYPRAMTLTNETAMPYIVARTHVAPGETRAVTVADEAHLKRFETDIAHLLFLNDSYKDADPKPLRLSDAE